MVSPQEIWTIRKWKEWFFTHFFALITVFSALILIAMAILLYIRSQAILSHASLSRLLLSTSWNPLQGKFGFFAFLCGTVWVTLISVIFAVPLCMLTAVFLCEYAPRRLREWVTPLIDLLAGIPSVVYGLWGILVIIPWVKTFASRFFGVHTSGYSILSASIVLAVMIFPIIVHISMEVIRSIPREMRDASLALGTTRWETVRHVVLKKAFPGLLAAIILGVSRAFGETMVVLMLAGNVAECPKSIFDPAYPLPALIANNYGEMLSIPRYDQALLFAALILMVVIVIFNIIPRMLLRRWLNRGYR